MIGLFSLLIGLIVYYLLSIIAIFNYPGSFDICNDLWTHLRWFEYNPDGAVFFRSGNVIYALTLMIFFLSINRGITSIEGRKVPAYLIQVIGISIAVLVITGEVLADQAAIFIIASGTSLLLTIVILIGFLTLLRGHPEFWKISVLLFIVSIVFSSYLIYIGVIDAPIREFRIIDFLSTASNQASFFIISLNMTRIQAIEPDSISDSSP